jgi:hypothetical protein
MKFLYVTYFLFHFSAASFAQSPEEVVQKQLQYYNARDIEGFLSVFDSTILITSYSDGQIVVQGIQQCRQVYGKMFEQSATLHSLLLNRIVIGDKVIDHELITGRNGSSQPLELVMIYQVKNGKIFTASSLRK